MATKKPQPAYLSQPSEFDLGAIDAFLKLPLPPTEEPPKPRSLVRMGADAGISLLKGAIAVPEAAVGLADLATGGRVGKFLENEGGAVGFRPEQAKRMLDELYSPEQQAAFQRVQQAEGVVDTAAAAVQNPSVIGHAVLESLPSIGAGRVVGRGAVALAPRMGVLAGALGEGTVAAGSAAEQVRQQTEDGLLTGQQAALAGGSGVATGLLGVLGGKVAQRLGINDVDTMEAGAARDPATAKGVVRRVLEGAFAEGILEELPQSVQEQVAQNLALDKPLDEGVDQAAVLGALSGGVMGFGANLLPRQDRMGAPVAPPPSGPMGRAVQAGGPAPTAPAMPTQPAGAAPVDAPVDPVLAPYADEQEEPPAVPAAQPAGLGAVMDPETGEIIMPEQPAPDEVPTIPTEKGQRAVFGSEQEAADYISAARRQPRNAPINAAPVQLPDGRWSVGPLAAQAPTIAPEDAPDAGQAPTGVLDGDVLNGRGLPFTTKSGAIKAAKAKGDGFEIVRVRDGFVVRQVNAAPEAAPNAGAPAATAEGMSESRGGTQPPVAPAPFTEEQGEAAPAMESGAAVEGVANEVNQQGGQGLGEPAPAPIEGQPINRAWSAFAEDSGTLGIPREQMPQVKAEHRGALVRFLGARGVKHEAQEVPADQLKPTQAEFSPAKVKQASEFTGGDRAILVSSDGYVLDGHHQWLAKRQAGEPVKVMRLDAPINDLLRLAHQFPSSTTAKGAPRAPSNLATGGAGQVGPAPINTRPGNAPGFTAADAVRALPRQEQTTDVPPAEQPAAVEAEAPSVEAPPAARGAAAAGEGAGAGLPVAGPAEVQAGGVATQPDGVNWWDSADKAARLDALKAAGWGFGKAGPSVNAAQTAAKAWADLKDSQRKRIEAARTAEATAAAPAQPAQPAQPAKPAARVIGQNTDGEDITEDENGVRSVAGEQEAVAMVPTRNGVRPTVHHRGRYLTKEEAQKFAPPAPPAPAPAPAPAAEEKPRRAPSVNTLVTDDAAERARAVLREKLKIKGGPGRKQAGSAPILDPDVLQAGITLAAYHIERGARKFAAYVQAMVDDMGDEVRPYLKSWYMAAKFDPRYSALDGLDDAATVEAASVDAPAEPAQTEDAKEATSDEHRDDAAPGPRALDEVAPEQGGGTEGGRATGADAADGRPAGAGEGGGTADAGVPPARSGGGGAGRVHPAEAGTRGGSGRAGRGAGRARSRVPKDDARAGGQLDLTPADDAPPAPLVPAADFRITDDVRLGQGGEAEKFRDNLAAIRIVKTLEREQRRATADEQRALARYVGWGGLHNAFADPMTGEFKPDWKARGEELRDLLTPAELKAAARSTRNAHYTSQTIVRGMWDAVRRLGFRAGLALESSMGSGNFLGLRPDDMAGTRFVGVEYDSLTARIAHALYPQATVLHSGLQSVPLPDGEFDLNIGNPPFGSESLRFQFKPEYNGLSIHSQFFLAGMDALKPGGLQAAVVSRYLLDAKDTAARRAMAERAKLIGAIRLPDTAFKENARTEVVTDILFFQRRDEDDQADAKDALDYILNPRTPGQLAKQFDQPGRERYERLRRQYADQFDWVQTTKVPDPLGGEALEINRYFADNPAMVLGRLERSGTMYSSDGLTVKVDKGADLGAMLDAAIKRLPEGVIQQAPDAAEVAAARHKTMAEGLKTALAGLEPGSIVVEDGRLQQVVERETPKGDFELARRDLSPAAPWSPALQMDAQGRWYRMQVKLGPDGKPLKNGRFNAYEREVFATEADVPEGLRLGQAAFDRLDAMVRLRDMLKRQLTLEADDAPARDMEANRADLAAAYDAFVAKHGFVNDPSNARLMAEMPDGALVLALETSYRHELTEARAKKAGEKARPAQADKAPILTSRVVVPYSPPGSASSAADALAITLAERGRVHLDRIASLLGTDEAGAIERLTAGDKPLVFKDPETQTWETRDAYLSGPIKRKLEAARAAGLDKNVAALEAVQPEPWGAENVTAILGSTWVPTDVYEQFLAHLTDGKASVRFSPLTNAFSVSLRDVNRAKASEWSSDGASVEWLVDRVLNSTSVRVMTPPDSEGKTSVDQEKTALAQIKARAIAIEFSDWVFADGDRRRRLVDIFNEKFNTRVSRQFDGSHLVLPGKVPDAVLQLRRHQKNAVWRGISQRFMLLDHVVGAGKTFTAIARVMERRRMGLSRKPVIVVPNHMVEQFAADVYRLYPGAKVLAAGKKDFERSRRRRLFAKVATGDWDVVILPHSSFEFISISQETEQRYLEQEYGLALQAIKDAEAQAAEDGTANGRRKPFGVKEAERLAEKIEARMSALKKDKSDRLLTFEQMGIDDLTVDEAHEFKNLFYSSRLTGVRGMNDKTGSQKAFDLYNKVRVLRESPTGTVTFMTGTPISNSAVEMFTMMRYLAAGELSELGLDHFDAWRAQFVDVGTKFEPTESGRLKEVNRLGRTWSNMRSLMDLYYSFTDAVTIDDIKQWYREDNNGAEFPVPKVKGGDRQSVVVKPTPAQVSLLEEVLNGFDSLDQIKDPYERNAARLRLMDRARKVSLDVRAAEPTSPSDEKGGKLDRVADEVARVYKKWTADRGTQLIFLDRSVPKAKGDDAKIKAYDEIVAARDKALASDDEAAYRRAVERLEAYDESEIASLRAAAAGGWNAYEQIKKNLIERGIPAGEIRFIQEANTDEQKQALFDAVNDGTVRVLIGSTPRMGAGTNVQKRLVALHHVDVTWKPSDIEQREGRIIRQGNSLLAKHGADFEVEILAYATERTADAKMWDLNATKLKTINGIRKYDGQFTMEFEDADSVSMAELAALASGDPRLLERVTLAAEIDRLELEERAHRRKVMGFADRIDQAERDLRNLPGRIEQNQKLATDLKAAQEKVSADAASRSVQIEGKAYASRFEADKAARALIAEQTGGDKDAKFSLKIGERRRTSESGVEDALDEAFGDSEPFVMAGPDGSTFTRRTDAARALADVASKSIEALEGGRGATAKAGALLGTRLELDVSKARYGQGFDVEVAALADVGGKTVTVTVESAQSATPTVATQTMRSLVVKLESRIARAASYEPGWDRRRLAEAERELPDLREKKGQPFPKADTLKEKRARLEALVQELAAAAPAGAGAAAAPDAAFSRIPLRAGDAPAAGVSMGDARAVVAEIRSVLPKAPPIRLHRRVEDAPGPLLAQIRADQAERTARAAYHEGEIHVFLGNMPSVEEMRFIVGHHEIRHHGLRTMLGPRLGPLMLGIYQGNPSVQKAADEKIRQGLATSRAHAVEEALADLDPKETARLTGFDKLAAMVRTWLRALAGKLRTAGMGRLAAAIEPGAWTDAEVAAFVLKAEAVSKGGPGGGGGKYHGAGTAFSSAPAASGSAPARTTFDVKGATGDTLAHYRGLGMQALGRRQIVDLWGKELPHLAFYNDLVQRMDADKNDAGAEADSIATAWGKLPDERALAELMHDATLARIDPAKEHDPEDDRGTFDDLRFRWNQLSPEAQKIYRRARDTYSNHFADVKKAIAERVERSQMSSDRRRMLLEKMDSDFFEPLEKGPYFPLARFGKYVVIVRDGSGAAVSVSRAETLHEAQNLRARLAADFPASRGYKVGKVLKDREFNMRQDGPGKGFMDDLYSLLEESEASDDLQDAVGQLYLQALPDLSWAKHGIHRKGTPGFSQDARRAFAQHVFHGARYLAKLRYADRLQEQLSDMQEYVTKQAENESFDSVKAQQVVDEMVKRHDMLMNPNTNPLSTALTSIGFVFHLGLSPASAMVNLLQTPMVALPIMGARWGFTKASAALLKASQEAAANRNDLRKVLKGAEADAFDEAVRTGVIDVTMAHDLAGIAEGEDSKVTWKLRPVMRWASFLFHHAERFNRQATFIAAFRLAKEAGASNGAAYEQAVDATYKGHFDYSASNRPRAMAGNWAKVLLLFKQFGQNMVYTLARQAHLAMKGGTAAERAEARKALGGLLVSHAAGAGILGLPLVSTILAAASWLGSDDDEPWDAEAALRNTLADAFGPTAADVMARGLSRLTPWDVSGRIGLNQMILPDLREGLEGRDLWESIAVSALGPVAGIAGGLLDGLQKMGQGDYQRGLEAMLPAALRGPVKALRYGSEGAVDRTGITILDEVDVAGVAGQALGFAPSDVRRATEGRSAIYQADRALVERRSTLMAVYAKAAMAGDKEGMQEAREAISRFNEKNPGRRITPQNLRQSLAARRRRIAESEQGIYLPDNRSDARAAGRFAQPG